MSETNVEIPWAGETPNKAHFGWLIHFGRIIERDPKNGDLIGTTFESKPLRFRVRDIIADRLGLEIGELVECCPSKRDGYAGRVARIAPCEFSSGDARDYKDRGAQRERGGTNYRNRDRQGAAEPVRVAA